MEDISNLPIGVFDSGCGGLTAVKVINEIMPNEDVIFFGDTARVPYGNKSRETVMRYATQDVAFLKKHKIKMVIAACGTVSSVVGSGTLCDDMPYTGVVLPTAKEAAAVTKNKKIGVLGTAATVRSQSFVKAIKAEDESIEVTSNACPLFVSLVECGFTGRDNKVTKLVAKQYLEPMKKAGVDTLILGCTHFPIIKDIISDIMGSGVKLISSSEAAVSYAKKLLEKDDIICKDKNKKGKNTFFVSDSTGLFAETASNFLENDISGDVYQAVVS